jgi:hypothetical protein
MPNKGRRSPKTQKTSQTVAKTKPRISILAVVLGAATLFGGMAAIVTFLPRVVVSPPSDLIDQKNVFDVSFDITNTGFIPLRDAGACFVLGEILMGGPPTKLKPGFRLNPGLPKICRDMWQHHDLGLDDRFTIRLTDVFPQAMEADIGIVVHYHPWFLPIAREKIFRFVADRDMNGKANWRSWPLFEPQPN